ncbi:MAG: ribonucleoside-diphosphate reductase, partial [Candidatus Thorarchaeota archaeon]
RDATVFLDCVAAEFMELARGKPGFEKSVLFTERHRALGLGVLGFHTYLQQEMIPFESLQAQFINANMFKYIKEEALAASQWMFENFPDTAEVPRCEGRRNTHLLAIAPNSSSALICGGVSQGIEPVVANLYNQPTAAGEIYRVNPVFLKIAKDRNKFNDDLVDDLIETEGSVQHLDWLSDDEKLVFKTAYEIDQEVIIRLASQRQQHVCQSQSLNLFFDADESEEHIAQVHKMAFLDPNIKGLYYMRTKAGVQASKGECIACEG